ncbi:MAG: Lysophospholipase (Lecithinase B)-like protein [Ramlibacter sp.]|nr:Lysophospholipase (Lecithinase B)-like protein [Ramlibacter sp.]
MASVPVESVTDLWTCWTEMMGSDMRAFGWTRRDFIAAGLAGAYAGLAPAAVAPVILVVGDSLSAEYGLKRGSGWVALLEQRLAKEKIPARVVNASISGDTTAGGRSRLPALLQQQKPTHVVIELGANDALRGLPLGMTEANLAQMTQAAQKAGARVLLLGMQVPPNYGTDYTNRFGALFGKVAKENKAALVPFFLHRVADVPDPLKMFQADRIHPTEAAHPLILDNVWPELKKMLAAAEPPQGGQAPRGGRAKPVGAPAS